MKIKFGEIKTYKQIAQKIKTSPRVVGLALSHNPDPLNIPCHRVIRSDFYLPSKYAFGGSQSQREKLEKEGFKIIRVGNKFKLLKFNQALNKS